VNAWRGILLVFLACLWARPALAAPPTVVEAYVDGVEGEVPVGALLLVKVDDPKALAQLGPCTDLRLFLNGHEVADLDPARCDDGLVHFALQRIDRSTDPTWLELVENRPSMFHSPADISIGLKGQAPLASKVIADNAVIHRLASQESIIVSISLLVVMLFMLLLLGRKTVALRDPRSTVADLERPYSLSRVQLAWWFFLVIGTFLYIYAMTGQESNIPVSILSLLGITVATVAGDQVVDKPTETAMKAKTRGFVRDLLTDTAGDISLSQFQAIAWTAVVGVMFFVGVLKTVVMVDLDPTLVTLMGLTSASYVGLKVAGTGGDSKGSPPTRTEEKPPAA
jgi:hypothetical protein